MFHFEKGRATWLPSEGKRRASAMVIYQIGKSFAAPRHNNHLNPDELSLKAPKRPAD